MNYRERMRKAIECPQFGNIDYGEYGALRLDQRKNIKRLLDEMDRADEVIKHQFIEIERLTFESTKWESKFYDEAKKVDKAIEYIEKNSYTTMETIDDINYFIVRLDKCVDLLDILKGVDKK